MEVKPGYKQTEVGVIPEEWEVKRLGELAALKNGYAFKSDTYTTLGNFKVITIANVQDGYMTTRDCNSIACEPKDLQFHQRLQIGDILISMTGNVGRVCRVTEKNCLLNQRVGKLVPTAVDDAMLFTLLGQPSFIKAMTGVAKGGAQPNLSVSEISDHRFCIPKTLPEQRAIAAALSDVDGLLGGLDRLIAKKRDLKQAAMQQLLTGQTRLPGFHGEWEVKTVAELEKQKLVKLSRGQVISKKDIDNTPGDFPIYSSSIHNDGLFGRYGDFMFDEELITWSVDGGGNFFHRPRHKFSVTNVCGFMRVDTSRIDYRFFAAELQLLHSRKSFDYQSKAHPSVIRKEYEVQLPTLPEQTAIAEVLTEMDAELAALEQRREKTRALKQAMMQELLTGRTRLVPVGTAKGSREAKGQMP